MGKRQKFFIAIFREDRSMAASMLTALAQDLGWDVGIEFVPPQASDDEIRDRLKRHEPDLIGLSFASYDRQQALEVARVVKDLGVKLIAGGIHATALPQDLVQSGLFDAIVQGDGMGVLQEILQNYRTFEGGQIIQGQRHANGGVYLNYFFSESQEEVIRSTRTVNVMTSIGCPMSCTYCASGRNDFFKTPEQDLVDSLSRLANKYSVRIFTFQDDLLFVSPKRVRFVSDRLRELFPGEEVGFGRSINARASSFTEELAEELVKMKVTDVSFGIESASTKLLKFVDKRQTEEHCYRAIEICKKFGLYSRANLMFGIPTQDEEDYEITYRFIRDARPTVVNMFYFAPYPGTDIYDYCFDHGYLPPHFDRTKFDWFVPELEGIRDLQCRLNNVDYELAGKYMDRIDQLYTSVDVFGPLVHEFDQAPWVLIGSSVQIYFSQVLKRLKGYPLRNCLGYWDLDPGAGYSIKDRVEYHQYSPDSGVVPRCFVTYCHVSSRDFNNQQAIIRERFGNVPLLSISSLDRHTAEQMREMIALT